MRKILFLSIITGAVWFFCFASPSTREDVLRSIQLSAAKSQQVASLAGKPVAPSIVQKLYSPHADMSIAR